MAVLVTGSSGYIGREIINRLEEQKKDYLGVDLLPAMSERERSFDLTDPVALKAAFDEAKPDLLLHCGTHSALAYRNNFLASFKQDAAALVNILELLADHPETRLVYFSSSYTYSNTGKGESLDEEAVLAPTHNFGVGKSFFERLILRTHQNSIVFRLSSVFGHGNSLHPNALTNMTKECMKEGRLTVWGKGLRKMQYITMEDVVDCTLRAGELEPGIYNLGGNEYVTVAWTAKRIAAFFGSEVSFLEEKKEGETLPFMINTKLKDQLGEGCITPIEPALDEYLGFFRKD